MADILSKEDRSKRMSLIRSKWTKPEKWLHNYLKGRKIKHKMHPKIVGSPDIILPDKKLALYIHGCFWHGCKRCYRKPTNNGEFWKNKLINNIKRDKKNQKNLRKAGWKVKIIWEHQIPRHKPKTALRKIVDTLIKK